MHDFIIKLSFYIIFRSIGDCRWIKMTSFSKTKPKRQKSLHEYIMQTLSYMPWDETIYTCTHHRISSSFSSFLYFIFFILEHNSWTACWKESTMIKREPPWDLEVHYLMCKHIFTFLLLFSCTYVLYTSVVLPLAIQFLSTLLYPMNIQKTSLSVKQHASHMFMLTIQTQCCKS